MLVFICPDYPFISIYPLVLPTNLVTFKENMVMFEEKHANKITMQLRYWQHFTFANEQIGNCEIWKSRDQLHASPLCTCCY